MEKIIERIIAIDKEAEDYKLRNRQLLEVERLELEAELQSMRDDFEKKMSLEVKTIQDNIFNEANEEAKNILFKRATALKEIQENYELKADSLVESLFQELKEKMKEG